jgi:hypothetical protein
VGYETLLIAYRYDDPLRYIAEAAGPVHPAGRCGICRQNVYVNASGAKSIRERDCAVICRLCRHDPEVGYYPNIVEAL